MSTDLDDYRAAAKRRQEANKSDAYKPRVGPNTIRLLPTPKGATSPAVAMDFAMHNEVGPEKKWLRCGIDPVTKKGKCWICQRLIPKLEKTGKISRAAKLAPQSKTVVQIADINDDTGKWTGPHLYYPSAKKVDEITTLILSKRRNYVDPKKGYNLGFTRTGTGKTDTRYGAFEPDGEKSKVPSKILDALKSFDALKKIAVYDEDAQKKAYDPDGDNTDDDEDFDDEDDNTKRKKKKSRDEEDEDEDDDSDDDGDSDDDEDDDDDADDDETDKQKRIRLKREKKARLLKKKKKSRS